jgi:CoA:oxalate CoA-transferase
VFFLAVNRGKESLAIDTRDWVAKRVLDNLVKRADALIHNLRFGAMDRLGLGADRCLEINPTLVYTTI